MAYTTASGLVVTDRRLVRVYDRDDVPNPNPPIGSVGPQSSAGDVMEITAPTLTATTPPVPPGAQAWAGWPNGWTVPWSNSTGWVGLAQRTWVLWAALDLNSSILATMPPYTTTAGERNDDDPSWIVNPQPEVYTDWSEFLTQLFVSWWLGEVFVWATSRFATGWPRTFMVLNPGWVNIEADGARRRYTLGGVDITADVLHIRYASWPGDIHGHGPLEAAYGSLTTAAAVEVLMAGMATGGGLPWAVLEHPAALTKQQTADLRAAYVNARIEAKTLGQDSAPLVLSGGLRLNPLAISVKDLALIDMMQLSQAAVATLFSCPPHLLNLPTGEDSLTYNNAESYRMNHWQMHLRPKAAKVMGALSGWLLPRGQAIELDRDEYVRPPLAERSTAYQTLFNLQDPVTGARALEIEEIRTMERFGPPRSSPIPQPEPLPAEEATTP